jgi:hypothetical protein
VQTRPSVVIARHLTVRSEERYRERVSTAPMPREEGLVMLAGAPLYLYCCFTTKLTST